MKFLLQLLFLLYILENYTALIHIPLKASFSEDKRSKFLLNLKLLQISARSPSFLQEVRLHQQVIAQKRLATYYGDIGVGDPVNGITQTFKMLFDTGSCEFWIPGEKCKTQRCLTHKRYQTTRSYQEYNGAAMSIQYLSGKVVGSMAYENIHLGDLEVRSQVIGVANEVQIPLLDEVIWDGILGLAYPNQNLKKQKIKPLFDNIIAQGSLTQKGEKNQFAYYLGPNQGAITFGGADMKYKRSLNEEFVWAPISEENYWTISLLDVRKEIPDSKFSEEEIPREKLCPNGCKAIIDTGTYLIYGPAEVIQKYFKDLSLDSCDRKNELPNLVFEFKSEGKSIELVIGPDDYVLQFKIDGQDDCVIGIGPDNEDSGWTLGQVFLRSFYTVFDRDNNRIGFVRANSNPVDGPPIKEDNKKEQDSSSISTQVFFEKKDIENFETEEQNLETPIFKNSPKKRVLFSENHSSSTSSNNGAIVDAYQPKYLNIWEN